jgi:hypothetical protein
VEDCGSVANADERWRHFCPHAQSNISIRADNAIAARTEQNEDWKEQCITHKGHFAEKLCRPHESERLSSALVNLRAILL